MLETLNHARRPALWFTAAGLITGLAAMAYGSRDEGPIPELSGATEWLNSPPLSKKDTRGKVVLVNFWTYSCINSLRELPYVKAWAAKYKDAGLVIIGVHAPEFGFEKNPINVKRAVADLGVMFPVPMDNHQAIWSAFHNEYWPADYFIDARGRIRHHHFGEGDYEESEHVIQELLRENGASGFDRAMVHVSETGAEAAPSNDVESPETYAGFELAENFVSREHMAHGSSRTYTAPVTLASNQWGLSGLWDTGGEHSALQSAPGKVVFRFHARDLHMVLVPPKNGSPIRFRVKLDGAAPGDDHGVDSGPDGSGAVREPRMYQLIRQAARIQERTFEIEFLDPGVEVFSFTFG